MAAKWRDSTVAKEVDILLGFAFKSAEFATEPPGYRLVRGDNVKRGALEWGEKTRYWRSTTPDLERYCLRAGDVVVGMDGSRVGENFARIAPEDLPALLVQRVACLRARGDLDQSFLRYLICNPVFTGYIKAVHTGTSIPHISGGQIGGFPIWVPPLDEQRAIAHILGALDNKIVLNRRMNETLEAMARALFKSWFVDFDPVRAKAEGRDPGLPKPLADLFPARLVDSELEEIPKGWCSGRVGDLCDAIYSGGTPSTQCPEYWNGDVPWLSSGETREKFVIDTERRITAAGVSHSSTRLAPALSTVIASAGQGNTRGQTSLLTFESYVNQSVVVLTANQRASSPYHLFFDLERRYEEFRRISDAHSSRGSLTTKLIAQLPATIPHSSVVRAFDGVTGRLVERIAANLKESRTLTSQRDAILPKLISGEVRLREVERIAAGVAA